MLPSAISQASGLSCHPWGDILAAISIIPTLTREPRNTLASVSAVHMAPINLLIRGRCCFLFMVCSALVKQRVSASIPLRHIRRPFAMYSQLIEQMTSNWNAFIWLSLLPCADGFVSVRWSYDKAGGVLFMYTFVVTFNRCNIY